MGYNSACVWDFCDIFAPIGGFSRMGHRMLPIAFFPTDPRCHGNEIWDKIGYNLACVRDFCEIFAPIGGFWGWAIEWCQSHFSRPTPVAMATKFRTKKAITRSVYEIYARFLRLYGCFRWWAIKCNVANCIFAHRPPLPWQRNLKQNGL